MDGHNDYAKAKDRTARPVTNSAPAVKGPSKLSEEEMQRCEQTREIVTTHMPEFLPFIKHMVELNLITGWRNIEAHRVNELCDQP